MAHALIWWEWSTTMVVLTQRAVGALVYSATAGGLKTVTRLVGQAADRAALATVDGLA